MSVVHDMLISWKPRLCRPMLVVLTLLVLLPGQAEGATDVSGKSTISILDREAPGTGLTYADVHEARLVDEGSQPVILPLPAPLIGAGIGLVAAFALRRRVLRS